MNFIKTVRFLSILFIIFIAFVFISFIMYINFFYFSFEKYYTDTILRKHNKILAKLKDDCIEAISYEKEEPYLLGIGIVSEDGKQKFYPKYSKIYWNKGKNFIIKEKEFTKTKPIKSGKIFFQVISTLYQNKKFISIYDASPVGYLYEKLVIIRFFIIIILTILPVCLYLIYKKAEKFYNKMLSETRENPLIKVYGEEPSVIIEVLKRTNEELKILLKKEKEKYNELEILSNTLSKNLPSGLMILDPANSIIKTNTYALKCFDMEKKIFKLEEIFFEYPEILKFLKEKVEEKKPVIGYLIEENEKTFNFTIAPLYLENIFLGTLILFLDTTETRKLEKALKQKETLANIGTFAAGIAHELRNSLSTIMGYAKLLQKSEDKREYQRYLEELLSEARHINNVITSFLEYTKIQKLEKEEVEYKKIIKLIIEPLKLAYPEINFIFDEKDIKLFVDPGLFSQALRAILENSCEAQGKGNIFISCEEKRDEIIIEIKDEGEGMDEETLNKIFIPFFSTKPSGTGLGLFLAHKVITLHNGKIIVNSKIDFGTTFLIILSKEVLQNDTPF